MLKIVREGVERNGIVIVGERQGRTDTTLPNPRTFSSHENLALGVKITSLTPQLAEFLGASWNAGALITKVERAHAGRSRWTQSG